MRRHAIWVLGCAFVMALFWAQQAGATAVKAFITVRYCNVWDDPSGDNFAQPGNCYQSARFTAGVLTIKRGAFRRAMRLNSRGEARALLSMGRYSVALGASGCCAENVGCFGDGPAMIDRHVVISTANRGIARPIVRAYDRRPV